jgi:predicted phosphodiesterase
VSSGALVGLISDSHGLLRPEVFPVLEGVDRILHAGDVEDPHILVDLAAIAPVTARRRSWMSAESRWA